MRGLSLGLGAVAALVTGGALLAGDAGDAGKEELRRIQGTWQFVAHDMDGKALSPAELQKMTITFTGNRWTVREGDKVVQAGTHQFDPGKKPPHLDAVVTEGEGKGSTMLGIYEMKGDTLRVCFDPQGKRRPTTFTPGAGKFTAEVRRLKK
jgi:uncharacterized protein (TIGR03067 family)